MLLYAIIGGYDKIENFSHVPGIWPITEQDLELFRTEELEIFYKSCTEPKMEPKPEPWQPYGRVSDSHGISSGTGNRGWSFLFSSRSPVIFF